MPVLKQPCMLHGQAEPLQQAHCLADAHLADDGAQAAVLRQVHLYEEVAPLLPGPVLRGFGARALSRLMHSSRLQLVDDGDAASEVAGQQAHLTDDIGVRRQGGDCLDLMQAPAQHASTAEHATQRPMHAAPKAWGAHTARRARSPTCSCLRGC